MAEVTAFRNNASIFPIYGLPWTLVIPLLDADGDAVTGAAGLDSEISKNGDTPADCTNEATEIGSSGQYYVTLTNTEMTADIVSGVTKTSTTGAKTTHWILYPRKLPVLLDSANAGAYDSTTTINLGSGASATDDYYNGCIVYIYGGTGAEQVRMITDYVGSTKLATVHVAWATNPDATSDLKIYRTEQNPYGSGSTSGGTVTANVTQWNGSNVATPDTAGYPKVTIKSGTGTGEVSLSSGLVRLSGTGVDDVLDEVVEGTYTMRQYLRLLASAMLGKVSGGGTATITFRDTGDSKNRIVATVDSSGNRTAITLTET